jgi:AraC-like DNA-binding protein
VNIHHHQCYQLIISLDNEFDCKINGDHLKNISALILNRRVPHACYAENANVLSILIESGCPEAAGIGVLLQDKPYMDISSFSSLYLKKIMPEDYKSRPAHELVPFVQKVLDFISTNEINKRVRLDERVNSILTYIDRHIDSPILLEDLAPLIFLSPERTRHLFSEQVGMAFSEYVIWKKIRAILSAVTGKKISFHKACVHYGFTDQSHFNKTFKRRFGMPPTEILDNCMIIG